MIIFIAPILKFAAQGEKTGWTYIIIPAKIATQLLPGVKKSFRVKGRLDEYAIKGIALLPMGGGDFIMPINANMRRAIGKRKGATLKVQLTVDTIPYQVNEVFVECMEDEPAALFYFRSLTAGHQNYFSKWIESAKTEPTKTKRIAEAVSALSKKMGYPEMIRSKKSKKDLSG